MKGTHFVRYIHCSNYSFDFQRRLGTFTKKKLGGYLLFHPLMMKYLINVPQFLKDNEFRSRQGRDTSTTRSRCLEDMSLYS